MMDIWWYALIGVLLVGLVVVIVRLVRRVKPPPFVTIRVNKDRLLRVPTGGALLYALADQDIRLPATCGGTASCTWCKCRVLKGGGRITEQETPYFDREQIKDHWRLACQVQVVRNMDVEVPPEVLHRRISQGPAE